MRFRSLDSELGLLVRLCAYAGGPYRPFVSNGGLFCHHVAWSTNRLWDLFKSGKMPVNLAGKPKDTGPVSGL